MKCSSRAWSLTLPVATYCWTTPGSSWAAVAAQIGHWRSTYSVTVTGAFGSPTTPPCSWMPLKMAPGTGETWGAEPLPALPVPDPPDDETTMATTTAMSATAPTAPSCQRRRRDGAGAGAEAGRRWWAVGRVDTGWKLLGVRKGSDAARR